MNYIHNDKYGLICTTILLAQGTADVLFMIDTCGKATAIMKCPVLTLRAYKHG